jgi:hypothetical protein
MILPPNSDRVVRPSTVPVLVRRSTRFGHPVRSIVLQNAANTASLVMEAQPKAPARWPASVR